MWGEQQVRTQLGPADPARGVPVPPVQVPAAGLIARAGATHAVGLRRRPSPARRPLLAGAAAAVAVAAVATYALVQPGPDRQGAVLGPGVVVPIAYEITEDPPPAAPFLRRLAASISEAPYDQRTGPYAHIRLQLWGGTRVTDGSHVASYVSEFEYWIGEDGTGTQRQSRVGVEYPDEESRQYYQAHPPDFSDWPETSVSSFSRWTDEYLAPGEPVPTDPRQRIEQVIGVADDGSVYFSGIDQLYSWHLVRRERRAVVLEVLAELPGVVWRGEVTDRAGRGGVAVSYDGVLDGGGEPGRHVLVFEPRTGELLMHEYIRLQRPQAVDLYQLHLDAGWTDDPGPEPTGR